MPQAPAAAAPPMAAGPTMQQAVPPQMDFLGMAKGMGLGQMKLDKNPAMARTQLMQHLHKKFGENYMANPDVGKLLEAFNQHNAANSTKVIDNADTGMANNLKALLG